MISEALAVIDAIEAAIEPGNGPLDYEPHASQLKPLYRKVKKIFARYFRSQTDGVLAALGPSLLGLFEWREAAAVPPSILDRISHMMPLSLQPLSFGLTQQDQAAYEAALRLAIARAGAVLWREMGVTGTMPPSIASMYLEMHGVEKLTGGFPSTTIQTLRSAIAKTYQNGGNFNDVVKAIKQVFSDFSDSRAEMIAQTEMNNAYNFGRLEVAKISGYSEKRWDVETAPCDTCQANHGQGWIPIDSMFSSGHGAPTAHPRCVCGLSFRSRTGGQRIATVPLIS